LLRLSGVIFNLFESNLKDSREAFGSAGTGEEELLSTATRRIQFKQMGDLITLSFGVIGYDLL